MMPFGLGHLAGKRFGYIQTKPEDMVARQPVNVKKNDYYDSDDEDEEWRKYEESLEDFLPTSSK
jgi:hypothetical protein